MKLRQPFAYDVDAASDESGLKCEDPSLTQQHEFEEADINSIIARYGVSGMLPQVATPPSFGDFESVMTYHDAMTMIRQAQESFMTLPAELRAQFDNDPGKFVEFVETSDNAALVERLGIRKDVSKDTPTPEGEGRGEADGSAS